MSTLDLGGPGVAGLAQLGRNAIERVRELTADNAALSRLRDALTTELEDALRERDTIRAKGPVQSLTWVITDHKGQPYRSMLITQQWRKLMAKYTAGPPWTFRALRNMSGTEHATGEHLGHTNTRTLERYYRLAPKRVTPAI